MRELALQIAKATAADRRKLIFWYYAGHGIQDNTVSMILNQAQGKYVYPIEMQLRSLSKCGHAYVIGLLDCCREKVKTRGGGHLEPPSFTDDGENIILAFGCPPSRETPAESTLAQDFFSFLASSADS